MPNTLIVGSTGSGKTTAELKELVRVAKRGNTAIIVVDPHRHSLGFGLLEQLVARGMKHRILYDRLSDVDRVLSWDFLRPSRAKNSLQRQADDDEAVRAFTDVLCRRRDVQTIATSPLTEEFVLAAAYFYIKQDPRRSLADMQHAFSPRHRAFKEMLDNCTDADAAQKFRDIANGTIKRGQFASAERLIRGVCSSPAFAVRCGTEPFNFAEFLDKAGILIIEGGGTISPDAAQTLMGAIVLQVIRYVRRRYKPYPPIVLVLEEANNWKLVGVTGHEVRALAECRKMGMDGIHILVQLLDFPTTAITEAVLSNTVRHEWMYTANAAVARAGAADLGDSSYGERLRNLNVGERYVKHLNHVYFEKVQALEQSWAFGLGKKKTEKARRAIKKRPEYRSGNEETPPLLPESEDTPVSSDTSTTSSPADRLRTGAPSNFDAEDE